MREEILQVGARLAAAHGSKNVTRRMIATELGCSEATVSYHVGTKSAAQRLYAKRAKEFGLTQPTRREIERQGKMLRARARKDVSSAKGGSSDAAP